MKTDNLLHDLALFAKKPIITLIIALIVVDIGIRSVGFVYGPEAQPINNESSLQPAGRSVVSHEKTAGEEAVSSLPALDSSFGRESAGSQIQTGNTTMVSLVNTDRLSRFHELPWHFSSVLESLNGIMSADTASLGIYIAEAQLVRVELFQQVSLRAVFQRWSELNLAELADFITEGIDFNDTRFNNLVIEEAIATLVQIAQEENSQKDLLNLLEPAKSPPPVIAALLATWSSYDPASALAWIDQNNQDGVLDQHLPSTLQALVDSDPELALERISQLPIAEQSAYLNQLDTPELTVAVPADSPQQAMEMLAELPADQRQARQEDILMQWFSEDAASAASWVANTHDPAMLASLETMIADLPRINLATAQDVFQILKPALQQQLVEGIARESVLQDESLTRAWIESLDNYSHRFLAESSVLQATLEQDPTRALAMASDYSGEHRMDMLQLAVTGVQRSSPELINQWIANAAITEDERLVLLSMISQ